MAMLALSMRNATPSHPPRFEPPTSVRRALGAEMNSRAADAVEVRLGHAAFEPVLEDTTGEDVDSMLLFRT